MATVDQLDSVLATVRPLVAAVGSDQWDAATPCPGWDVRTLLGHLVAGNHLYAAALAGQAGPDRATGSSGAAPAGSSGAASAGSSGAASAGSSGVAPADSLGADPAGAYQASAVAVVEAFRAPGALDRPVTVPFGTVPGETALHLRIVEVLTHGWDLARATGRTVSFPDDVVEQEIAFSRRALPMIPPERAPFAPSQSVADDAAPLDRLVALLGRDPG